MFSFIHNRKEPYVSWKGTTSKFGAVPTWSRPIQSNSLQLGNTLRAMPLKHWRKQLIPEKNSGSGVSSIRIQDTPNSTSVLNSAANLDKSLINGIVVEPQSGNGNNDSYNSDKSLIKSAQCSIGDKQYNNSTSYMEGICMLYRQKLSTIPIEGIKYVNQTTGEVIWPSDDPNGTQNRSSIGCSNPGCNNIVAIYKPNNDQFANQGAVDSSSRLTRLKYNTIYENGGRFATAWSARDENSGKRILKNNGCVS